MFLSLIKVFIEYVLCAECTKRYVKKKISDSTINHSNIPSFMS